MDPTTTAQIDEILTFWFGALEGRDDHDPSKSALWWKGAKEDDDTIRERFGDSVGRALQGELDPWAKSPRGCLALVILLDQFTRSLGRGTAEAFAGDRAAQKLCRAAIEAGLDRELRLVERAFFYLPLMHAEDREVARLSELTFSALSEEVAAASNKDLPDFRQHARKHADIVLEFGRYPHRNELLGRTSTPEEEAFLASGGPTFGQKKKD
jgi:uncharacterized protein (DUF924 family)